MKQRYRPFCRVCGTDPVDREGAEVCDWCAMTPEEREKAARRGMAVLAIVVLLLVSIAGTLAAMEARLWR